MGCLTCAQLKDRAYTQHITNKLDTFFTDNPCVDCGETDKDVLIVSNDAIWTMIAEQTPWPKVNRALHSVEVVCANCAQRRIVAKVGPWGIPNLT